MTTVTIHVTEQLIRRYGSDVFSPFNCPVFHALKAAGLPVHGVGGSFAGFIHSDGEVSMANLPEPARLIQQQLFDRKRAGAPWPDPVSFELEVPDDLVPAGSRTNQAAELVGVA